MKCSLLDLLDSNFDNSPGPEASCKILTGKSYRRQMDVWHLHMREASAFRGFHAYMVRIRDGIVP